MKTIIEIELPELPEPKKNHKWESRGVAWETNRITEYAFYPLDEKQWNVRNQMPSGNKNAVYFELVRTHREDGTPLDIPSLPPMPDNVERVEYFGIGMKPEDMGDADCYIYTDKSCCGWINQYKWEKNKTDMSPGGFPNVHYARVWYKKETVKKTQLSDLIGEDGQKIAYLINSQNSYARQFVLGYMSSGEWCDAKILRESLRDIFCWSNSPFTKFKDANPFIF